MALQNGRALDLLTAERGRTCIFLQEEWRYYISQSGIVTSKICELHSCIQPRRESLASWGFDPQSWTSWLLRLAGPLLTILLPVTLGPCVLNGLICFIENNVSHHTSAQVLALQGYRPLDLGDNF